MTNLANRIITDADRLPAPVGNYTAPGRSRATQSIAERCDNHIAFLYALSYLQEHTAAESAVADAMAKAAGMPAAASSTPLSVWRVLATHFHALTQPAHDATDDSTGDSQRTPTSA